MGNCPTVIQWPQLYTVSNLLQINNLIDTNQSFKYLTLEDNSGLFDPKEDLFQVLWITVNEMSYLFNVLFY